MHGSGERLELRSRKIAGAKNELKLGRVGKMKNQELQNRSSS
jgi:hypothetical protein